LLLNIKNSSYLIYWQILSYDCKKVMIFIAVSTFSCFKLHFLSCLSLKVIVSKHTFTITFRKLVKIAFSSTHLSHSFLCCLFKHPVAHYFFFPVLFPFPILNNTSKAYLKWFAIWLAMDKFKLSELRTKSWPSFQLYMKACLCVACNYTCSKNSPT
jgi:hypothetical protein